MDNSITNTRETQQQPQQPQQQQPQQQLQAPPIRQFRSQVSAPTGYNNIDQYQQQQQSFNYNYKEYMQQQQQQQVTYSQPTVKKSRGGRAGAGESAFAPFSVQAVAPLVSQGEPLESLDSC